MGHKCVKKCIRWCMQKGIINSGNNQLFLLNVLVFQRDFKFYWRLLINRSSSFNIIYCMFIFIICFDLWLVSSISKISFNSDFLRYFVNINFYLQKLNFVFRLVILFSLVFLHYICSLLKVVNFLLVNLVNILLY